MTSYARLWAWDSNRFIFTQACQMKFLLHISFSRLKKRFPAWQRCCFNPTGSTFQKISQLDRFISAFQWRFHAHRQYKVPAGATCSVSYHTFPCVNPSARCSGNKRALYTHVSSQPKSVLSPVISSVTSDGKMNLLRSIFGSGGVQGVNELIDYGNL